jgi:hypothetical protein
MATQDPEQTCDSNGNYQHNQKSHHDDFFLVAQPASQESLMPAL